MNFYEVDDLNQTKYKDTGLDMTSLSKILKDIGSKTSLKTLDDIMGYTIVLLKQGEFSEDNPNVYHKSQIKNRKEVIPYCLVTPGKEFNITNKEENYSAKIINGELLLASPEVLPELVEKEIEAFKDLSLEEMKVIQWLETGETGLSSLSLCAALYPQFKKCHHKLEDLKTNVPHDLADFNRALKFIEAVPEAREKISLAKEINPVWSALIDNWDVLEQKTLARDSQGVYAIIQECKGENIDPNHKAKNNVVMGLKI